MVRRQWHVRSVPALYLEDIEAVVERLRQHVARSDIERRERRHAVATGRDWVAVKLEADGLVVDDALQLQPLSGEGPSELRLRTFGYTVTLTLGPSDLLLTVDDDPRIGLQAFSEIQTIVRRRRRPAVGFLASEWGVPSFVLAFPIVSSILETALGRPGLTLLSLGFVSVILIWWLWSTHGRSATRRPVIIPHPMHASASLSWSAGAPALVGVVIVLAVVGVARKG